MMRCVCFACVILSLVAVRAGAADAPRYASSAQATRSGDKIAVSIKVVLNKKEVVPTVGETNVDTTLPSPQITLVQGQRAQIAIGSKSRPAAAGAKPQDPSDIESGQRVDVISIKGQDSLVVVTTVIENGEIVWAQAATVPVKVVKAPK